MLGGERKHLFRGRQFALEWHQAGADRLPQNRVRDAKGNHFFNSPGLSKGALDLGEKDIVPAADRHVSGASGNAKFAVTPEYAEVAGMQPVTGRNPFLHLRNMS